MAGDMTRFVPVDRIPGDGEEDNGPIDTMCVPASREGSFMTAPAEDLLTHVQRELAGRVRDVLRRFRVSFTERVESSRAEAWHTFRLETSPQRGPDVRVHVVDDTFAVAVDDASLHRDRVAWRDDVVGWMEECVELLEVLLRSPLRIRIRRTWLGRRTGAIWVPAAAGDGAWSGDWAACRGRGVEITFPATWYHTTSS